MLLELCRQLTKERSILSSGGGGHHLVFHHLLSCQHGLQVSGDGSLQLRTSLVKCPQTSLKRNICTFVTCST